MLEIMNTGPGTVEAGFSRTNDDRVVPTLGGAPLWDHAVHLMKGDRLGITSDGHRTAWTHNDVEIHTHEGPFFVLDRTL